MELVAVLGQARLSREVRVTRGRGNHLWCGGGRGAGRNAGRDAGAEADGAHDTVILGAIKVVTVQARVERLKCVNRNTPAGGEALAGVAWVGGRHCDGHCQCYGQPAAAGRESEQWRPWDTTFGMKELSKQMGKSDEFKADIRPYANVLYVFRRSRHSL